MIDIRLIFNASINENTSRLIGRFCLFDTRIFDQLTVRADGGMPRIRSKKRTIKLLGSAESFTLVDLPAGCGPISTGSYHTPLIRIKRLSE